MQLVTSLHCHPTILDPLDRSGHSLWILNTVLLFAQNDFLKGDSYALVWPKVDWPLWVARNAEADSNGA